MNKILLAINTALQESEICLIDLSLNTIIAHTHYTPHNNEAELLIPTINKLMNEHNINFSDLTAVAVISGPGSFASLRVGVIVANTLVNNLSSVQNCFLFSLFDLMDGNEHNLIYKNSDTNSNFATLNLVFAGGDQLYWNSNISSDKAQFKNSEDRNIAIITTKNLLTTLDNHVNKLKTKQINNLQIKIDGPEKFITEITNLINNADFLTDINIKVITKFSFGEFLLKLQKSNLLELFKYNQKLIIPNYIKEASISIKK